MLLPLGMGVASANAGFSTVQAGGPPSAPARHVSKPTYVHHEKPILRSPRWRPPNIDIFVHNRNHSRNDRHHVEKRHEEVKPDPVKEEKVEEYKAPEQEKYDDGKWWWPDELR
ncbi:hypothetical protein [Nonomuraea sp. NPDC002799]